jgi:outer membrane lipoprotein-sorting protein
MSKFISIVFIIFLSHPLLANEILLSKVRGAFQQSYSFEEGAFDDTASKVSYSKGNFIFNDNDYRIIIEEPLSEEYVLNSEGLTILDHEFNQEEFIPLEQIQNPFIALLLSSEFLFLDIAITNKENVYSISHTDFMQPVEITLFENKVELVRYIDQLNVTHIINFSPS